MIVSGNRRFGRGYRMRTALAMLWAGVAAAPLAAETLQDALAAAYANNPALDAVRAAQRATDEGVAQAKGGWRPTVEATGSVGRTNNQQTSSFGGLTTMRDDTFTPKRGAVSLVQPLFRGFKTVNSVNAAEADVYAGREELRGSEQQVLLDAVTAYMDVKRDEAVLELNRNNVQVLQRQLEASQDRFRVGEITRTDVAQSEARLSRANSDRIRAESALIASRAAYRRVMGVAPGSLEQPGQLPELPASEEDALALALAESPVLRAAQFAARAAEYDAKVAVGDLLPQVDLRAEYDRGFDTSTFVSNTEEKRVVAQLTIPLYQAGVAGSVVRQSRQVKRQRVLEVMDAERLVEQNVRNAWESLREAQSRIRADEEQVKANAIALEGVRQEADVGSRTTLDVLDAEQEYLDSQVSLVTSQRDEVVAAYGLLASVGRLSAMDLGLAVAYYDPEEHYNRVRDKFFGWTIEDE